MDWNRKKNLPYEKLLSIEFISFEKSIKNRKTNINNKNKTYKRTRKPIRRTHASFRSEVNNKNSHLNFWSFHNLNSWNRYLYMLLLRQTRIIVFYRFSYDVFPFFFLKKIISILFSLIIGHIFFVLHYKIKIKNRLQNNSKKKWW